MLRKRRSSSDGSFTTDHHNNFKNDDYDGSKGKTSNIPRLLIVFLSMIIGAIGVVEYWNPKSLQDFGRGLEAGMSEASVRGALTNGNSSSSSDQVHVIFSTDCSAFQHWQSYLLAFSAYQVKQHDIGTVVRIASGCGEDEEKAAQKWHDEHIANVFGERYRIHFTPHFSSVKDSDGKVKGDYKFFNKPFGLRHWMANTNINDNDIVILIDPDMIILTQLNGDFSSQRDVIVGNKKQEKFKVEHGSPFGQTYGFGAQWSTKIDLAKVAGADSPSVGISRQDAFRYYPVGPPYLATARDMRNIAEKWSEFVPGVHKQYPYLLAEMFAYCVAAAHLKLPHQRVDHLMVSNVGAGGEGWPFVDEIIKDESTNVCEFATFPVSSKSHAIPSVIHYCQRYMLEKELFSKRRFNTNFYSCDTPSLTTYDNDFGGDQKTDLKGKRNAFMLCAITSMLNASLEHFKNNHCSR